MSTPSPKTIVANGTLSQQKLMWFRHQIQKAYALVKSEGATAVSRLQLSEVEDILGHLSIHPFEGDDYRLTKIGIAVGLLCDEKLFGDDIASKAYALRARWKSNSFEPGPLTGLSADEEFSSAEESSESDDGVDEEVVRREPNLMRGISIALSAKGRKTYSLARDFAKRDADVFGPNGHAVGAWWPYQICALRDGAHGSRGGGIHGRINSGAYSIVISGAYDDKDSDRGDTVLYSGSRGAPDPGNPELPPVTNATQSLIKSYSSQKPVRVLRSSKCNSRWAPSVGIRYDGTYRVEGYNIARDGDGKNYYQFRLTRDAGQEPIDRRRPNQEERAAYARLTMVS